MNNNNNNLTNSQIIDFDNYDPFGGNGTNNNQTQAQNPSSQTLGQTVISPTSSPGAQYQSGGDGQPPKGGLFSMFSFDFFKIYFDVQGDQVLQRAMSSFLPKRGHLERNIKDNPDFYGPLWISVTLIVSSAISHGVAQFIQNAPKCVAVDTDMRRISFVTTSVFLYAFLLPTGIWSFLKYQNSETRQNLASYICLYGYSMAIFVPLSILWVLRAPFVMWPLLLGATAITSYSLIVSLWPSLEGLSNIQSRVAVAAIVLLFHFGLAFSLGSYVFEPTVNEAVRQIVLHEETGAIASSGLPATPISVKP